MFKVYIKQNSGLPAKNPPIAILFDLESALNVAFDRIESNGQKLPLMN